jgi:carotenoid cleavage dioxygenase-like enzyme
MDGPTPTTNPYLSGNFAPVRSEDDYDLEVAGEIPSGLRGAFYRNGPIPSSSRAATTTGLPATA